MDSENRFDFNWDNRSLDEAVAENNNDFNNFGHSDADLSGALRGMEDRTSFFENPAPGNSPKPKFVSHAGFDFLKDLDDYIKELNDEIKSIKDYWKENGPRLEELNEKIEKKYANFRNGADRSLDTEIEDLEEEYLGGLEQQEEHMKKLEELNQKLEKLVEARKRWLADVKERTAYTRKKKNELLEQLARAQKELKDLQARQYAGDDSQFVKDRIEELKDIIANLEQQLKDFHKNAGYGKDKTIERDDNKVRVKFDLGGGKIAGSSELDDMLIDKGTKITDYLVLNSPELDDNHVFDGWTVDGDPFDLNTPVDRDIVVKANYRTRGENHTVTFRDKKGRVIGTVEVEDGQPVPSDKIPSMKNKLFKDFAGWGIGAGDRPKSDDLVSVNLSTFQIRSDQDFYPVYKLNREKVLGTGFGCIATSLSIGGDLAVSAATANPYVLPAVSGPMAVINGVLWGKANRDKKAKKVPNEEAARNATGIKKAGIKLRNFGLRHLDGIRYYLGTTTIGTAAVSLLEGGLAFRQFANASNTLVQPEPQPVQEVAQEVPQTTPQPTTTGNFSGVDPNSTIYKDQALTQPNGKPAMEYFDRPLSYFRNTDGSEIIPGRDTINPGESFSIVEHQADGSEVVMGNQMFR